MPPTEVTSHKDAREKSATSFPPELRVKIYEELLINSNGPLHPNGFTRNGRGRYRNRHQRSDNRVFASILRVCRTFYKEALPVLYGRNILAFYDASFMKPVLPFPKEHLAMVKHVHVDVNLSHEGCAAKMGNFLIDLHWSGAELVDLSVRIHALVEREYNGMLPPSQLDDGLLAQNHPMVVGLSSLKAVKKLDIDFEGKVRFESGVADALRESFLKEQSTVSQSITIRKACTIWHEALDPEEPCWECGNTRKNLGNGIGYCEYRDDETTRELTEWNGLGSTSEMMPLR